MNKLFKKLLAPRQLEYLSIDENFIIIDFSIGVQRFAEANTRIQNSIDARSTFPELIGLESVIRSLLLQDFPHFEIKSIRRQDNYFDILFFSDPDHPSIFLLFEDVTERMKLEQELAQRTNETLLLMEALTRTKNYLEQAIDRLADVILVTTSSGIIKIANQIAKKILGEDVIGKDIKLLTNSAIKFDSTQSEIVFRQPENRNIIISFSCSEIPIIRGQYEYIFCGRDITMAKQMTQELEQAKQEAIAHSKSKSIFLANMSHEIRTPMNSVLGMAELLLDTNPTPEQQELIEGIQTGGETLLSLINNVLDISKLESGQASLDFSSFELRPNIEEIMAMLAPQAHLKGLEINAWIDSRLGMKILGDRQRFKQIIINLVNNAIKFTDKGEVNFRLELSKQTRGAIEVYGTVADTGIGIPVQQQDKLFQPFFQVDINSGGTGLGLSICHQLASLMGGEIGLLQSSATGTTFWFKLSFSVLESAPESQSIKHQFIIISPFQTTIDAAKELGLSLGINFVGILSIDQLPPDRIDGILIDSSLGNISIEEIKAKNPSNLILLLPAHQIDRGKQALQQGFDYFLTKPLRSQRLNQLIAKLKQETKTDLVKPTRSDLPTNNLRILLAEDNPANQLVARKLLEKLGYKIDIVNNGEEALAVWFNYDLILMDCQMPILDGYNATKAIRAQQKPDQKILIVAMTANAMESDRQYCLECGMNEYITKPISMEALRNLLQWAWHRIGKSN